LQNILVRCQLSCQFHIIFSKFGKLKAFFPVYTWGMTTNIKSKTLESERLKLPLYAWFGLGLVALFWIFNWTLTGARTHWGFFPLWLGYCLTIDGLVFWRTGTSLLTRSLRKYIG
jgi:hypothetical protein